jgi:SAM-dependent methyltransferase
LREARIGESHPARRLFFLGFASLFSELLLIRYLAGSIWNLGYFPNLVLIGTFLGMGLGFLLHRVVSDSRSPGVFQGSLILLLALVGFVSLARPGVPGFVGGAGEVAGELFFTSTPDVGLRGQLPFVLWFLLVVAVFAAISQRTAKLFGRFAPLRAYTLDISGSCAGILAFMVVSWLQLPAWVWFLLLVPIFLGAAPTGRAGRLFATLALCVMALLVWRQDRSLLRDPTSAVSPLVRWSPYQKVELAALSPGQPSLFVNGLGHQQLLSLPAIRAGFYETPHTFRWQRTGEPYGKVLVIGAGGGNDVAAALDHGAEHVDAVEIDPVIAEYGREHHPARPYADPRVRLVVDDGRAFLNRTRERYDLIVFALTDSLVKVSPVTQLRLENYVFTEESLTRAFRVLAPGGDLVFYNFYREPWLVEKMQETIRRATGRSPRALSRRRGFAVLLVGGWMPEDREAASPPSLDIPRDDWPFLYLRERAIPRVYLTALAGVTGLVAVLMALLQRFTRHLEPIDGGGRLLLKISFVLMGAAFLLLETKGVIQFSLLFGTTWLNNSLVFLSALLLVLAANAVAARARAPLVLPWTFGLLMAACALPLVLPLSRLLAIESVWLRAAAAGLFTFSPIFFANLLFSLLFRDQPLPEHLFGWNLLGATLGGLAEYASMWVGYRALAVLVIALYAVVFGLAVVAQRRVVAEGVGAPA